MISLPLTYITSKKNKVGLRHRSPSDDISLCILAYSSSKSSRLRSLRCILLMILFLASCGSPWYHMIHCLAHSILASSDSLLLALLIGFHLGLLIGFHSELSIGFHLILCSLFLMYLHSSLHTLSLLRLGLYGRPHMVHHRTRVRLGLYLMPSCIPYLGTLAIYSPPV